MGVLWCMVTFTLVSSVFGLTFDSRRTRGDLTVLVVSMTRCLCSILVILLVKILIFMVWLFLNMMWWIRWLATMARPGCCSVGCRKVWVVDMWKLFPRSIPKQFMFLPLLAPKLLSVGTFLVRVVCV